jgi:hypothetical protein
MLSKAMNHVFYICCMFLLCLAVFEITKKKTQVNTPESLRSAFISCLVNGEIAYAIISSSIVILNSLHVINLTSQSMLTLTVL